MPSRTTDSGPKGAAGCRGIPALGLGAGGRRSALWNGVVVTVQTPTLDHLSRS